jgi:hypothetical protein
MAKEIEEHKLIVPSSWVERIEEVFHIILSIFLLGIAAAALVSSVIRVFETNPFFPTGMIQAINDILFQLQNFLIIGVIAAVRHILTVGASMTLASGKSQEQFDRAILELAVSAAIVVALVFAIFLSRASNGFPASRTKRSSQTS